MELYTVDSSVKEIVEKLVASDFRFHFLFINFPKAWMGTKFGLLLKRICSVFSTSFLLCSQVGCSPPCGLSLLLWPCQVHLSLSHFTHNHASGLSVNALCEFDLFSLSRLLYLMSTFWAKLTLWRSLEGSSLVSTIILRFTFWILVLWTLIL